jgi:hypothetical protein
VAVPLLRAKVPPAPAATDAEVEALVRRLDAPEFAAREAATRELGRLGGRAVPALRAAASGSPSPEAARRIDGLLRWAAGPDPDGPARARAVEVAERAGTAAAQELLAAWAGGAADAPLTREARQALDRLRAKAP